ncbi:nuclease-related domain-containing protein [Crassaminicella profunda]|uniref:nuclease-related domain-containing protein n=1 Tax=Crassaminicella profunda TaxID=1286698 RepID=UPI001CA7111E|nr:nuclease-related domain-containing protein [Crassaminicella profunda]QZY54388.1 NERD domain-containing protein [Crassaminicella profunda]
MAIMIPDKITRSFTEGEREVFYFLEEKLPSDYFVWYELDVEDRYPDFVIVGPQIGVLILEVKDWSADTIQSFDQDNIHILKRIIKI